MFGRHLPESSRNALISVLSVPYEQTSSEKPDSNREIVTMSPLGNDLLTLVRGRRSEALDARTEEAPDHGCSESPPDALCSA